MHLTLVDARCDEVARIWQRLEAAARPAYFLTWGWIETWLACLPLDRLPKLAVLRDGDRVAGACFVTERQLRRYHVLPSRALYVNVTGDARLDELCVEHNAILGSPGLDVLLAHLPPRWDEVFLPAMQADQLASAAVDHVVRIERRAPSHYVDLGKVRAAPDFLALLGSSTRAQIRRARRRAGDTTLEVASTLPEALAIYSELVGHHGRYWRGRGQFGAFADPWFDQFHRRLIAQRFAHGEIALSRLRAGGRTLGCLYNLVAHDQVAFYQSGLVHLAGHDVKPGYLCHVAAIEHAARAGHATYDFLGGDARYKRNLSTDTRELVWARVQRRLARFALEDRMRRWARPALRWVGDTLAD